MYIRNLIKGELLPVSLPHGFPVNWLSPQPEWVWIAYSDDHDPLALIMAAPVQGIAMLVRVCASAHAPSGLLLIFVRKVFKDMLERGYNGYLDYLQPKFESEAKILNLFQRASKKMNVKFSDGIVMVTGPTNLENW